MDSPTLPTNFINPTAMAKIRWMEHEEPTSQNIKDEILRLLLLLRNGESICPSEAARAFGARWRQHMPHVTEVVADMSRDEIIEVTLKGAVIDVDDVDLSSVKGPIRLQLLSSSGQKTKDSDG